MYKPYWEQLRDPRWQKRRLEILQAANFACTRCDNKAETLHVHHKIYRKGWMAWDYGPDELVCLCASCHEAETNLRERLAEKITLLSFDEIEKLVGYAEGLFCLSLSGNEEFASGPAIKSATEFEGICDAMNLTFAEASHLCNLEAIRRDFILLHRKEL